MHQSESICLKSKGTLKTCRVEWEFSISSDKIWSDLTDYENDSSSMKVVRTQKYKSEWSGYRTSSVCSHTCLLVTAEAHAVFFQHACKHPHGTMRHEWHKCYGSTPHVIFPTPSFPFSYIIVSFFLLSFLFLCPCIIVFPSSSPLSCSSYLTHDILNTSLNQHAASPPLPLCRTPFSPPCQSWQSLTAVGSPASELQRAHESHGHFKWAFIMWTFNQWRGWRPLWSHWKNTSHFMGLCVYSCHIPWICFYFGVLCHF